MKKVKYEVITTQKQYERYCKALVGMVFGSEGVKDMKDEIHLLNTLIDKWEEEHAFESTPAA